jgi:hypothetical protein
VHCDGALFPYLELPDTSLNGALPSTFGAFELKRNLPKPSHASVLLYMCEVDLYFCSALRAFERTLNCDDVVALSCHSHPLASATGQT